MKILFLGGKRFYGNSLLKELIRLKKFQIYVVYRNKKPAIKKTSKVFFIKCERDSEKEILKKLNKERYDFVFDNNCYNVENCKKLIQNLKYKNFIYIFTSSVMTYIYNNKDKINYDKKIIDLLPKKAKQYIKNKSDIEKYLTTLNIKYLIFKIHNLIGNNDHSGKTNFIFDLSSEDLKKFDIKEKDKVQFALVEDVVKIVTKKMLKINPELFNSEYLTIANRPFSLKDIIYERQKINKKKTNNINFKIFPIPLNYIIKKSEIIDQKHTDLKKIFNFLKKNLCTI
jgi:nucleoside-diphosphate-sugar epimerase